MEIDITYPCDYTTFDKILAGETYMVDGKVMLKMIPYGRTTSVDLNTGQGYETENTRLVTRIKTKVVRL